MDLESDFRFFTRKFEPNSLKHLAQIFSLEKICVCTRVHMHLIAIHMHLIAIHHPLQA